MRKIETERSFSELGQELMRAREPVIELLRPTRERFNKYGPLSEPSFRRPG